MRSSRTATFVFLTTLPLLVIPSTTLADSGTYQATVQAVISLTPFCTPGPSNSNCTGARWLDTMNARAQPIRGITVELRLDSTGALIGTGVTNASGNVSIPWSTPTVGPTTMSWNLRRADGRFHVKTKSGADIVYWNPTPSLSNGTTTNNGTLIWGNGAHVNVYYATERAWTDAFSSSSLLWDKFTGVTVKVGDYSNSSYTGGKTVQISDLHTGDFDMIVHELGHIASDLASGNFSSCGEYGYGGMSGHSLRSPEWQCAGFEEGIATGIGSRALYWQTAIQPIMFGENLETPTSAPCSISDSNRWELRSATFWRDFYDSVNDGSDTSLTPYAAVFDVLDAFGGGHDNHDKNEPYNTALLLRLDDKDGRSAEDFRWVAVNRVGLPSAWLNAIYAQSCSPVGD